MTHVLAVQPIVRVGIRNNQVSTSVRGCRPGSVAVAANLNTIELHSSTSIGWERSTPIGKGREHTAPLVAVGRAHDQSARRREARAPWKYARDGSCICAVLEGSSSHAPLPLTIRAHSALPSSCAGAESRESSVTRSISRLHCTTRLSTCGAQISIQPVQLGFLTSSTSVRG